MLKFFDFDILDLPSVIKSYIIVLRLLEIQILFNAIFSHNKFKPNFLHVQYFKFMNYYKCNEQILNR